MPRVATKSAAWLLVLAIVRSTPVAIRVVCVNVLLVSSASKIALLGSTVTVLLIEPSPDGATATKARVLVDCAGTLPVQVSTLGDGSYAQVKPPAMVT